MVLVNYVGGGLRRKKGGLHDGRVFAAVLAAASRGIQASRSRHVLEGRVGHHRAAVCGLAGEGADGVETSPQQNASDDQEQDAAGQPDAHGEFPAGSVVTFAAFAQSAEHLALLPYRIGGLTCHAQEVSGLGEQVR